MFCNISRRREKRKITYFLKYFFFEDGAQVLSHQFYHSILYTYIAFQGIKIYLNILYHFIYILWIWTILFFFSFFIFSIFVFPFLCPPFLFSPFVSPRLCLPVVVSPQAVIPMQTSRGGAFFAPNAPRVGGKK